LLVAEITSPIAKAASALTLLAMPLMTPAPDATTLGGTIIIGIHSATPYVEVKKIDVRRRKIAGA
jgi:hypothetical protein